MVEIRNVEIKSVSVVQTEHRLFGWRQEPYNYTQEEVSIPAALNTLTKTCVVFRMCSNALTANYVCRIRGFSK